jgi:cation diffusion facilitator CzcD-associated flavoprotein CzcO
MAISGLGQRSLEAEWKDGAEAYLGISVTGFPNFFLMYGPNTNLGHNSIIFMIECQAGYIVRCVQEIFGRNLKYLDLQRDTMNAYNERLQGELRRTAWAATDHSWYKTEDGKITNNWSGTTARYWWLTRKVEFNRYHREAR